MIGGYSFNDLDEFLRRKENYLVERKGGQYDIFIKNDYRFEKINQVLNNIFYTPRSSIFEVFRKIQMDSFSKGFNDLIGTHAINLNEKKYQK